MDNEIYEESDLDREESNAAAGLVVGCGAVIAFLLLLTLFLIFYPTESEAQKMDPVKLQVEPFIPADTCAMVYDMTGFKGRTMAQYIYHMEWQFSKNDDPFLFLYPPELISFYRIEFKPRKACLSDLLDQMVSGTDLAWSCEGSNILIWRR